MRTSTILIIDDEVENLKALERTLMSIATVLTASSAKEGLEIVQKESIALIICDQRMPEMTGIEFFKKIILMHPEIIRIILTGYTDVEDLIEAINEAGLYRYITKPWNNHDLQLIVKRALEFFEVRNLSLTDELTQIGNQRFFGNQLNSEIERSKRYKHDFSLLLIDIDFFKQFNDEFGHDIGDKALKIVAQTLKKNIRNTDILARCGGEEFGILLPETSQTEALHMAERIRKSVSQKTLKKLKLTISIGVATYTPKKTLTSKSLLKKADQALYQAKKKGRNCVIVL